MSHWATSYFNITCHITLYSTRADQSRPEILHLFYSSTSSHTSPKVSIARMMYTHISIPTYIWSRMYLISTMSIILNSIHRNWTKLDIHIYISWTHDDTLSSHTTTHSLYCTYRYAIVDIMQTWARVYMSNYTSCIYLSICLSFYTHQPI